MGERRWRRWREREGSAQRQSQWSSRVAVHPAAPLPHSLLLFLHHHHVHHVHAPDAGDADADADDYGDGHFLQTTSLVVSVRRRRKEVAFLLLFILLLLCLSHLAMSDTATASAAPGTISAQSNGVSLGNNAARAFLQQNFKEAQQQARLAILALKRVWLDRQEEEEEHQHHNDGGGSGSVLVLDVDRQRHQDMDRVGKLVLIAIRSAAATANDQTAPSGTGEGATVRVSDEITSIFIDTFGSIANTPAYLVIEGYHPSLPSSSLPGVLSN